MTDPDGPIVADVRMRALEISRRFGNDLRRYAEHLKAVEDSVRGRVVSQITVVPDRDAPPVPERD